MLALGRFCRRGVDDGFACFRSTRLCILWRQIVKPPTLLIVDRNRTFLQIVEQLLRAYYRDEVVVVGVAAQLERGLEQARGLQPQVVLLDIGIPGLAGLSLIPRLRAAVPGVWVVAMVSWEFEPYLYVAMAAGADASMFKDRLPADLLPSIRRRGQAG
jgi:two-component system, NarL family, nitrate/nitrite response regulator NarL